MSKYCLYGNVKNDYSKLIHNFIYLKNNIDATYEIYDGNDVIKDLRNNVIQGINVTTPYKVSIIEHLDCLDERAKRIGAVNTVFVKDGKLIGYNTDYDGFMDTMKYYQIKAKKAHILGRGGAAKAVKAVLDDLNIENVFVGRDEVIEGDIDLLVNATSVYDPVSEEVFNKAKTVIDLHYDCPRKTNGLFMLVSQAVKAEELWLGVKEDPEYIFSLLYGGAIVEHIRKDI